MPSRLASLRSQASCRGAGCLSFLLLIGCGEAGDRIRPTGAPRSSSSDPAEPEPPADPVPPWFSLTPGDRYFEREGLQAPVLMRNMSAPSAAGFLPLIRAAREAGTSVARVQISQGFGYDSLGMDNDGGVLSSWASSWDTVFEAAETEGLAVIVVFTLWGDWNDGDPALGWSHFDANPLSSIRGGPAASPAELFADTETQRLWLGWMSTLIRRWSSRPNVIAWEIFSELDLATGATEAGAVEFVERAHEAVREIDPWRPAYASTSDLPLIAGQPWQALQGSPGNDIASVHPYAENLDSVAVDRVRSVLTATNKPVLIGESGLDAAAPTGMTLTSGPRAAVGLRHAIWAELMSGAASARSLYWEDGYAAYYPATGLPLVTLYQDLEREAASWLIGKDFGGRTAAGVSGEPSLFGSALADATRVSGWARNDLLYPPDWSAPPLDSAVVRVTLPMETSDAEWRIRLTNPEDGSVVEAESRSSGGVLAFEVPGPFESIAFDAERGGELPPVCPNPAGRACVGPIYALALDGSSLFADPECPDTIVQLYFRACLGRRSVSLSSCPTDGSMAPRNCVQIDAGDVGDEVNGAGVYYDAAGAQFD